MRVLAALLLAAIALAGCTDGVADASSEQLVVSIRDVGGGYDLVLPLWLGDGASADDWIDAMTMTAEDGSFELTLVGDQVGVHVWGTGITTLNAHNVGEGDRPRAYLDGAFSLGGSAQWARMQVLSGDVDVLWQYEGSSDGCSVFINQYWTDVQEGWHVADPNSSRSPPPDCV